jgi:hypothetical protein
VADLLFTSPHGWSHPWPCTEERGCDIIRCPDAEPRPLTADHAIEALRIALATIGSLLVDVQVNAEGFGWEYRELVGRSTHLMGALDQVGFLIRDLR